MKVVLEHQVCPLDATLESVLPGVHQRFVQTNESMTAMGSKIESGMGGMENRMNARFDLMSDESRCITNSQNDPWR
jgi:hypothetical protein